MQNFIEIKLKIESSKIQTYNIRSVQMEKDLTILIVLCLLNILASLDSREFTSMVMSA